MAMSEEELRKQQQSENRFARSQGMYNLGNTQGAEGTGGSQRQVSGDVPSWLYLLGLPGTIVKEGSEAVLRGKEPSPGPNQVKASTSSWWNPLSYGDTKVVTAPMPSSGDPFAAELAAARRAGAAIYDPQFYREQLDIFSGQATAAEAIAGELEKGVQAAYGQAGAQSRKSAQEMYREGQRTAAEVAGGAEASAARAAGYLSGQGMPQTMVSGLAGTSGGASYDPTMGRAYGGIQAEAIGREAALAAQEEAARGGGAGQRKSLVDLVTDSNAQMRRQLMSAESMARSQGRRAEAAALQAVNDKMVADKLNPMTVNLIVRRADLAWENQKDQLEAIFGTKEMYDKAIAALVEQNSRKSFENYWSQISFMAEDYGGLDSYKSLLPPSAAGSAEVLAQLGIGQ